MVVLVGVVIVVHVVVVVVVVVAAIVVVDVVVVAVVAFPTIRATTKLVPQLHKHAISTGDGISWPPSKAGVL